MQTKSEKSTRKASFFSENNSEISIKVDPTEYILVLKK